MANTYTKAHFHLIFAPKNREALIKKEWKNDLEKYITGIVQNKKHKMLAINCMPDHVHVFIGYSTSQLLPNLVRDIKAGTSKLINDRRWVFGKFECQAGYGAFSYSKSQIDSVVKYILYQKKHHEKQSFKEEYIEFLTKFEIDYKNEYVFEFYDD